MECARGCLCARRRPALRAAAAAAPASAPAFTRLLLSPPQGEPLRPAAKSNFGSRAGRFSSTASHEVREFSVMRECARCGCQRDRSGGSTAAVWVLCLRIRPSITPSCLPPASCTWRRASCHFTQRESARLHRRRGGACVLVRVCAVCDCRREGALRSVSGGSVTTAAWVACLRLPLHPSSPRARPLPLPLSLPLPLLLPLCSRVSSSRHSCTSPLVGIRRPRFLRRLLLLPLLLPQPLGRLSRRCVCDCACGGVCERPPV